MDISIARKMQKNFAVVKLQAIYAPNNLNSEGGKVAEALENLEKLIAEEEQKESQPRWVVEIFRMIVNNLKGFIALDPNEENLRHVRGLCTGAIDALELIIRE